MNPQQTDEPKDDVSPTIKFLVAGLTIVTVLAFSVFIYKFVGKVTSPSKERPWALELQVVGDKLKKTGLNRQAIAQYSKFLEFEKIDLKTRALVAQTLGELYTELGDCQSALVWFYQAEVAGPDPTDEKALASQIATCLKEVQSGRP